MQENALRSARLRAGLTQQAMSDALGIPKRTIENWEGGSRKCPDWAERLIIAELDRIAERKKEGK